MGEVLSLLENLSGKKLRIRWEEEQKGDVQDTYADISKARRLLGYAPKIKLAEGLEKEIAWMKGEL
jgi:nucleoside-diphosphate-sugar epimerase